MSGSGERRLANLLTSRNEVGEAALAAARERAERTGERLGEALIAQGAISDERLSTLIATELHLPIVRLSTVAIDPAAAALLGAEAARTLAILPFARSGRRLSVACADAFDRLALDEVEASTAHQIVPHQTTRAELQQALARQHPELALISSSGATHPVAAPMRSVRLGFLAIRRGWIDEGALQRALAEQKRSGELLGRTLLRAGLLDEISLARLLAEQYHLPFAETLDDEPITPDLAAAMPREEAQRHHATPLGREGERWIVALADPRQADVVRGRIAGPVAFVAAPERSVAARTEAVYAAGSAVARRPDDDGRGRREKRSIERAKPLSDLLVELGYAPRSAVDEALEKQRSGAGRFEELLLQSGKLSDENLARAYAQQFGYEYLEGTAARIDPLAVALVPEATVRRYQAMPLRLEGNALIVALRDPRHVFALDDLRLLTGREITPVVASESSLTQWINRFYREGADIDELTKAMLEEVGSGVADAEDTSAIDDNALVKMVNNIIREAILADMSDIHIEPRQDSVLVRVRKDGALRQYMTMPKATAGALASRIKIMGGLNIAERRLPQDGRIRYKDKSIEVDLRLSTLPTVYGEKIVMRLLKKAVSIPEIEQLGFAPDVFQRFRDLIAKPYGMFLITGPTGSGKSFTTFSILKRLAVPDVNVTTIEDPVEYEIPGINQTQVNQKAGLDFARALRSFLRQDPDIIMVGEVRDHETAKIAMEAALTGHLLIATLHTNDAAGAVVRLTEMGIEPFNVSASLIGVLAQRLVRKVCRSCREPTPADPEILRRLEIDASTVEGVTLMRGRGCDKCSGTGYDGRHAIHELLTVDDDVARAIVQGRSAFELREIALSSGMRSLRQDGVAKALAGITTLEEVLARTAE
jgi:type IV pilus assembly protein PilB